jgi:hypothetical protein
MKLWKHMLMKYLMAGWTWKLVKVALGMVENAQLPNVFDTANHFSFLRILRFLLQRETAVRLLKSSN